jgi:hypothetical protein
MENVTFFKMDKRGILRCLPCSLIMTAESATLKLDNQKNGWKGVCVHQEANGEVFNCPVKALACQVIHIRKKKGTTKHCCQLSTVTAHAMMSLGKISARV